MKKISLLIIIATFLTGCGSTPHIQRETPPREQRTVIEGTADAVEQTVDLAEEIFELGMGLLGEAIEFGGEVREELNNRNETDSNLHPVVRVIDGDTIIIMYNGAEERVRFIGVDAPEMGNGGSEAGAEEGAIEARDFVARAIEENGGVVALSSEGNDRCRFGRLRRHVYTGGQNLGELLITNGLATNW